MPAESWKARQDDINSNMHFFFLFQFFFGQTRVLPSPLWPHRVSAPDSDESGLRLEMRTKSLSAHERWGWRSILLILNSTAPRPPELCRARK